MVAADIAELFRASRRLHQKGQLAEAEACCRRVLAAQPDHADAMNLAGLIAHQMGRHEVALEMIRRAIQRDGQNAGYWSNLGNVLYRCGKLGEAVIAYHQAINIKPDFAEVYCNLASALKEQGKLDEAVAANRHAIRIKPNLAESHDNLGVALKEQGKLDEAVAAYRLAISIRPDFADAHFHLGVALGQQGKLNEAVTAYRQAIRIKPNFLEAHNNLGGILNEQGSRDEAIAAYRQAISIGPYDAKAHYNLGKTLAEQGKLDQAVAAYRQAISIKPDFVEAQCNLGGVLKQQGKLEEAIALYRGVIRSKPDYADGYSNLGFALAELGELDEARNALESAVKLAPANANAYRLAADLKRFCANDPYLAAMEKLARDMNSLSPEEQIDLHFALAKAYEDLGKYEPSFRHLLEGNALKRKQIVYDELETFAEFDRIRSVFTPSLMRDKRGSGDRSSVPIFIIGMARSGTTLIEQILASHPNVFGAGELETLAHAVARLRGPGSTSFPEAVVSMSGERLSELGTNYMNGIVNLAPEADRITDKMPLNFRFAGLIHLALPNARIIHACRDPLDTCLSCFSKLFGGGQPYSYDLAELGHFYRAYDILMKHWRIVLPPGVMLEVRYEDLTSNLEGEARRILGHCGLEWDDRCLAFHETQRPVRTVSAVQVRQPIYRSSVGRAAQYKHLLGPLIEALGV